jgi:Predicted integral membrane protein
MKGLTRKELTRKFFLKKESWMILICVGLLIKIAMFPVKLGDYNFYLAPWINFIKTHGYASSLKYNFYNYTPSYIYILIALAKTGFNPLYSIKIVSIVFEYILAYYVGKIAYLKYENSLVFWISFAVIPVLPAVLLNGAFWGQCDSIYSAFVLGSFYYACKKKQLLSILFLGIAIAFKVQAVFILPLYFVMMLRSNIKWFYFLLIPLIYLLSILPTWLYGRPLSELLTIYFSQSNYFKLLTLHFPNIYIWIPDDFYDFAKLAGVLFTTLFTLLSGIWLSNKKYDFSFETWIELAFLSVIIIPFLLPGMHERYLYLGDIMAALYFILFRKNIHFSLGIILVSFYAYLCCSRLKNTLPLEPAFIIYLLVIVSMAAGFIKRLKSTANEKY